MKRHVCILLACLCLTACRSNKKPIYEEKIITLPLYEFKDNVVHDELLCIVSDFYHYEGDEALFIEYYDRIDTIHTYPDSIPFGYNLFIQTIHDEFRIGTYDSIVPKVSGCCMIGDEFCYISNNGLTIDRLFTKTTDTRSDTIYVTNRLCYCVENDACLFLTSNDSIICPNTNRFCEFKQIIP